jgi:hypothetical protein
VTVERYYAVGAPGIMQRASEGHWVRYEDHRAALQAVEADTEHLEAGIERERDRAEQAEKQLEELRGLLGEALAAEKCAVACGEVGAFDDDFRTRARAFLATQPDTASEAPRCGG